MYSRVRTRSDLLALLRTIGKGDEFPPLASFTEKQVRWIIDSGLAPLVCFASRHDSNRTASRSWPNLRAADLTSRLMKEIELETLNQIIEKSNERMPPITLLKGCSVASELYPQPHLRLMRDIDLLVEAKRQRLLESILLEMGFLQDSTNSLEYYATHHHSMPFYHPRKRVWVEVHRGLFPRRKNLAELPVFSPQNITAESKLSSLRGDSGHAAQH